MFNIIQKIFFVLVLSTLHEYNCDTVNIFVKSSVELEKITKQLSKSNFDNVYLAKPQVHNSIPTIREASSFNATADAIILRKATHGFGTDEDAIIKVLTRRSHRQRQFIAQIFKHKYEKVFLY